ncbi:hypothetical protein [Microvirga sp. CF3016]|uniref:hypothetical protein n=1 Tax=Microvirga sp. CF3016 TaxID=3110181 RepID=UPI002E75B1B6|nr:hypothetical protein [Microvirga sp. CF3016]MEE1613744.1 hypothetical protein [Microvirga sp. CF3016]
MRYAPLHATLLLGVGLTTFTGLESAMTQHPSSQQTFEQVAAFEHQVTGVAVSQDGRHRSGSR